MERKKASDFPQELLTLFDRYVHGEIRRREFLDGAQKFAVGGVTATALFEMLRPNYAWAIQVPESDNRIKVEPATVPSPRGNGTINGYMVRPANATGKLPAVLVVHENRGLNPYIKDVARRLAIADFLALAPDGLTSVGGYPGDDERGAKLFTEVDRAKMTEDFLAAATWLKSRPECTGKFGAVGFCFGEALSTYWPCGWALTLMLQFHSTEISPVPPMWPGSRRQCLHTTANWTPELRRAGRPLMQNSLPHTSRMRGTFIVGPIMASTTIRRPVTTTPQLRLPGSGPWTG